MARSRMMVFVGVVAFAAVCWLVSHQSLFGKPRDTRDTDRAAINAVLKAQQAAWNRGDVDAFLVGYWQSPELTFSGSNGVSRGWDGVLARYQKNYPNREAMGELDFSDLEFRFLGSDAALVLGKRSEEHTSELQSRRDLVCRLL